VSVASGGVLILDEDNVYWLLRAVGLGDDDGVFSSRTIFKASETVSGLGWAAPGPFLYWFGGLHGPTGKFLSLFSFLFLFDNSVFYFII
jgi:hypothetical protein